MDNQLNQNFKKLAQNIIIRLNNDIIAGEDYLKFQAFFKWAYEYNILNNNTLVLFAESLINAQIAKDSEDALIPIKDEICLLYQNLLCTKTR